MYRPVILNKWNIKCITFVSLLIYKGTQVFMYSAPYFCTILRKYILSRQILIKVSNIKLQGSPLEAEVTPVDRHERT
jgi:hypothetical protein